jgi:Co/Zn/Cd efflux system component
MTSNTRLQSPHKHIFLRDNHAPNERRTWLVIVIAATMMVMLIAALAYMFARKIAHNPQFTFGTGKLGDLAAFGSAVVLTLIALLIS